LRPVYQVTIAETSCTAVDLAFQESLLSDVELAYSTIEEIRDLVLMHIKKLDA